MSGRISKLSGHKGDSGFTLIELSVFISMLAILVVAMVSSREDITGVDNNKVTSQKLERIKTALERYKDGTVGGTGTRYPCPANAQLAISSNSFGAEGRTSGNCIATTSTTDGYNFISGNASADSSVLVGAVPVKTLGLRPEDAFDAWGNRIMYAVGKVNTKSKGGYITVFRDSAPGATPQGNANVADNVETIKAAYVLISYGKDGIGAFPNSGGATRVTGTPGEYQDINAHITATTWDKYFLKPSKPMTGFDDIVLYKEGEDNTCAPGLPPAVAGEWKPSDFNSLVAWFDASDSSTVFTRPYTAPIKNITCTSGVATVEMEYQDIKYSIPHLLDSGEGFDIAGSTYAGYNGSFVVKDKINDYKLTFNLQAGVSCNGSVVNNPPEMYITHKSASTDKAVVKWKDKSGRNNDARQNDPYKRPSWTGQSGRTQKGLPVVEFRGGYGVVDSNELADADTDIAARNMQFLVTNQVKDSMGVNTNLTKANTIFIVAKRDFVECTGGGCGSADINYLLNGNNGNNGQRAIYAKGSKFAYQDETSRTAWGELTNPEIHSVIFRNDEGNIDNISTADYSKSRYYVNGMKIMGDSNIKVGNAYGFTIGSSSISATDYTRKLPINDDSSCDNSGANTCPSDLFNSGINVTSPLKGYIAEIIVYDRELTSAERERVEAYLTQKWFLPQGLVLWLDATATSSTFYSNTDCSSSAFSADANSATIDCWKDRRGWKNTSSMAAADRVVERNAISNGVTADKPTYRTHSALTGTITRELTTAIRNRVNFSGTDFLSNIDFGMDKDTGAFVSVAMPDTSTLYPENTIITNGYNFFLGFKRTGSNKDFASCYGNGMRWNSECDGYSHTPLVTTPPYEYQADILLSMINGTKDNAQLSGGRAVFERDAKMTPFTNEGYKLGRSDTTGPRNDLLGNVHEIMIFDCPFSCEEKRQVEQYLHSKWKTAYTPYTCTTP